MMGFCRVFVCRDWCRVYASVFGWFHVLLSTRSSYRAL